MNNVNYNQNLSQHIKLGELCKTSVKKENTPNEWQVENLRRLCRWLEHLRARYNERYVKMRNEKGEMRNEELEMRNDSADEEPIIINSGYRSYKVNKAVGGAPNSNHLTGCAADIRCYGIEQALRYASILLDISDESQEKFDELLIERNANGNYWVHFAVRPKDNRRRISILSAAR